MLHNSYDVTQRSLHPPTLAHFI